jgi:uncharacterized protein with predicted RNA binding PUA domain
MDDEGPLLHRVAAYQFGAGAGPALFPPDEPVDLNRSSSGRPRQVFGDDGRIATYRPDGRFTLGAVGARRLAAAVDPPRHRVVVGDESEPYVREGRNAFAKFVRRVDEGIRPGDEVLVVGDDDELFAVGRADLPGTEMLAFETGVAASVRSDIPAAEAVGRDG